MEIPEIISNNIFLYKNFHYSFVKELQKNISQSWSALTIQDAMIKNGAGGGGGEKEDEKREQNDEEKEKGEHEKEEKDKGEKEDNRKKGRKK